MLSVSIFGIGFLTDRNDPHKNPKIQISHIGSADRTRQIRTCYWAYYGINFVYGGSSFNGIVMRSSKYLPRESHTHGDRNYDEMFGHLIKGYF